MTQVTYTQEAIKALLETSNKAVEKALLTLYDRQTMDEQATSSTSHVNGRGFSAFDAEILSSFACWIQRKQGQKVELGKCLTEKQMGLARKKIVRYAKQLAEVANAKAMGKVEEVKQEDNGQRAKDFGLGVEEFSTHPLDVLKGLYGIDYAIEIAKRAVEDEAKRVTSYYNGRPILSILKEKLASLEEEKATSLVDVEIAIEQAEAMQGVETGKAQDSYSDPEHRAFRVAQDKISQWMTR